MVSATLTLITVIIIAVWVKWSAIPKCLGKARTLRTAIRVRISIIVANGASTLGIITGIMSVITAPTLTVVWVYSALVLVWLVIDVDLARAWIELHDRVKFFKATQHEALP